MSSRTKRDKERRSKRDGVERHRHPGTDNRHERPENDIPRSYNDGDHSYSANDEDLVSTMSRLEVDSSRRGKGKGKHEGPAWSDWTWSHDHNCYYRARLKPTGDYEYEYSSSEAYTTAPGGSGMQDTSVSPTPAYSQSYSDEVQTQPSTGYPVSSHHTSQTDIYHSAEGSHDDQEYDSTSRSHDYYPENDPPASSSSHLYQPASSSYSPATSSYHPASSSPPSTYPVSSYSLPPHTQGGSRATSMTTPGAYASGSSMTGYINPGGYGCVSSISGYPPYVAPTNPSTYSSSDAYSINYGPSSQVPQDNLPPVFVPPPNCDCDPRETGSRLCGVIIWPKQPEPNDGRVADDSSRSSKSSTTGKLVVRGPSGQNCGPLVMPGITPGARPREPPDDATSAEWEAYYSKDEKWMKGFDDWSKISCPCGYGYFNSEGIWVSGGEARAGKLNPLWEHNGGKVIPQTIGPPGKEIDLKLREREPQPHRPR